MAVLHSYAQSADQSGYYLKGWTPETGHTTIQVRRVCEDLFQWLGFSVGDQIPHDLLNGLLEVGLLYTGDRQSASQNVPDDFQFASDVKNVLTEKQYSRLIGFAQSYEDSTPSRVQKLINRLDDTTVVVDDEYIPDTPGNSGHGSRTSRNVDHGQFENIIKTVFEQGKSLKQESRGSNSSSLPRPLQNIQIPDSTEAMSAVNAAAKYHRNHFELGKTLIEDSQFQYSTRLLPSSDSDSNKGSVAGFRFYIENEETVVIETIVDPEDLTQPLEYGEPGVWHRLVISTERSISWETMIPSEHAFSWDFNRSKLLQHQVEVIQMLEATIESHPGISAESVVSRLVSGGYLERGTTTSSAVWQRASILGELLGPESEGRYTGKVAFFNDTGGYGFVEVDAMEEDVFFHMDDIEGSDAEEGERMEFDVIQTEKGPRATDISRL